MNQENRVPAAGGIKLAAGALCLVLLSAAGPPPAKETSICDYKFLSGSGKGLDGQAKIEISGDTLKWFVESPVPFLPPPQISYIESEYKILENNRTGLVAVGSDSRLEPVLGPVIVAEVVTIRKADGALYVGSVSAARGVSEELRGSCKVTSGQ